MQFVRSNLNLEGVTVRPKLKKLYPRGAVGDGAHSQQPSSSTDPPDDHEADMDEACHVQMLNVLYIHGYISPKYMVQMWVIKSTMKHFGWV